MGYFHDLVIAQWSEIEPCRVRQDFSVSHRTAGRFQMETAANVHWPDLIAEWFELACQLLNSGSVGAAGQPHEHFAPHAHDISAFESGGIAHSSRGPIGRNRLGQTVAFGAPAL